MVRFSRKSAVDPRNCRLVCPHLYSCGSVTLDGTRFFLTDHGLGRTARILLVILALAWVGASSAHASDGKPSLPRGTITDTSFTWPSWADVMRVLTLRDYNTRVVIAGAALLGLCSGVIGTFMLLRKRALLGDALSHATLPGIGSAFVVMTALGATTKSLLPLLVGATITGGLGVVAVLFIRRFSRIKEDAALGIVLSVWFGLGVAILGGIQKLSTGHAAGLESFIYGKTASMLERDALMIAVAAALVSAACLLLFKELSLLCFDADYAKTQGFTTVWLDLALMTLVVLVTVIGLQAVGLILMIALLVIPPAAARFWTEHLPTMTVTSAGIGMASGFVGACLSALVPRLPAGAIIVIVSSCFFSLSLLLGRRRGVWVRWMDHHRLRRSIARQHLLRALFERQELFGVAVLVPHTLDAASGGVSIVDLQKARSWSPQQLRRELVRAERDGLVYSVHEGQFGLTPRGWDEARRFVRRHRLWELYLITHADVAPSHVDRDADQIEHVLPPSVIAELESLLASEQAGQSVPPSPHVITT